MILTGLVVAQDLATATCGLLNAGYFVGRCWQGSGSRGRRLAAATLAMVSAAAVIEAFFSQGLFWSRHGALSLSELSSVMWALVRLPLFVATVAISIIILRRLLS